MSFLSRRSFRDDPSSTQKGFGRHKKVWFSREDYLEANYQRPCDIFETSKYLAFPDFRDDDSTCLIYCFKKETYCRNGIGSILEPFDSLMEFDARFLTNGIKGTVRFGEYRFSRTFLSFVFEITEPKDARHFVLMVNTEDLPCAANLDWLKNDVLTEKVVSLKPNSPYLCVVMDATAEINFTKKEVEDNHSPCGSQATYQKVYESFVANYFDRNCEVLEYTEVLTEEERKRRALAEEEEKKEQNAHTELLELSQKIGQSICENLKEELEKTLKFFDVTLSATVEDCRPTPELVFRVVPRNYLAAVFTKRFKNPLELEVNQIVIELRDSLLTYFARIRPQFEAFSAVAKAERAFLNDENISNSGYASKYPPDFFKNY